MNLFQQDEIPLEKRLSNCSCLPLLSFPTKEDCICEKISLFGPFLSQDCPYHKPFVGGPVFSKECLVHR